MLLLFLAVFLPAMVMAQDTSGQNPNAQQAYDRYSQQLDEHEATMGATVDNTYEAQDPIAEKARMKAERQQDRREFRQQRRLERIQRNNWNRRRPFRRW